MICHVVSARPNFIKAKPVIDELKNLNYDQFIIHTGQHYDKNMSSNILKELEFPSIRHHLNINKGSSIDQISRLLKALEEVFISEKPRCVIIYGDVNATMAASIAASHLHIPIIHIEAGLRSNDMKMPEEVNRRVADILANYHFTTSIGAKNNLINEGVNSDNIYFVGNTMIDTLLGTRVKWDNFAILEKYNIQNKKFGIVTIHRPSNVDNLESLKNITRTLNVLADKHPILFPIHPRTRKNMIEFNLDFDNENIQLIEPLSYFEFINLLDKSLFVLTDSGGIQEEAATLNIPCITMRDNTERPITIEKGTNTLVGSNPEIDNILEIIKLSKNRVKSEITFWDGKAGKRIAQIIKEILQ